MRNRFKDKKTPEIAGIIVLLLIFPLLLLVVRFTQDIRSSAAAPDKLETEAGVLSSSGVTKQSDSGASGGSFVLFNKSSGPTPTTPPNPDTNGIVGSGVSMTSLSNTRIGYSVITHGTYRFKAEKSLSIKSARIYLEADNCDGGYGLGDGGRYYFSILPDNGSGLPSLDATPLGSYITPSSVGCVGKVNYLITFSNSTQLSAGNIYHLVTENIHPNRTSNYVSLNAVYVDGGEPNPYHPITSDSEGAVYYRKTDSSWVYRYGHLPILDLTYSDNSHQGWGYMEISHVNYGGGPSIVGHIGGSNMIRERFTYNGPNKSVSSAFIRIGKISGNQDITLKLKQGSNILGQTTIPASQIPVIATNDLGKGSEWLGNSFSPVLLQNSQTYTFELSALSGSDYRMWPIRMGKSYDYDSATYFNGLLEYSTDGGSSWAPLGGHSNGQRPYEYDLQFYLK